MIFGKENFKNIATQNFNVIVNCVFVIILGLKFDFLSSCVVDILELKILKVLLEIVKLVWEYICLFEVSGTFIVAAFKDVCDYI